MVRVRFYRFTLSLPIILVAGSIAYAFLGFGSVEIGFNVGTIAFAFGFLLQLLFSLTFACPRCGKSPYAIGPSIGPFAFAGKPIPDAQCSKCGYDFVARGEPGDEQHAESGKAR